MKFYTGCSGFYYKEWKNIFYPAGLPAKDWFKYYCKHYNTIEINSTFYRIPSPASLERWYQDSPEDFLFSIKAPRTITHLKRFDVNRGEIDAFYHLIAEGLQQKLGNILFQMPPSFSYTPEGLLLICEQLDNRFHNVVEFRHASWWQPEVFERFRQNNIIFCGQSYPGNLPETAVVNGSLVYYRFHGKPVLYKSEYPEAALQELLNQLGPEAKKVFIYFNNTWGDAALKNSRQMQELVFFKNDS